MYDLALLEATFGAEEVASEKAPKPVLAPAFETGDQFDHDAARGFIRLWGLGQQTQAQRQLLKGGRAFELPGLLGPGK